MARLFSAVALITFFGVPRFLAADPDTVQWRPWSDSVFAEARTEHRFVLLDLGTVWCHWCHVMDGVTYGDPLVIRLIKERYIPVRVDADARPDLANRYEDYGWPATIVFNEAGGEIVKRRGYLPPLQMESMLKAIIDDPSPGPSVTEEAVVVPGTESTLGEEKRMALSRLLADSYDPENAGWGSVQKFLDADIIEYSLTEARRGDARLGQMARETLQAELQLLDPSWGGVYQYSTDGDWKHPHFEKIMQRQADDMYSYSEAYALWGDNAWRSAALRIRGFLKEFLTSPDGAFYTSQDADLIPGDHGGEYFRLGDAERREKGIPRIDKHIYSRENGWAIRSLATFGAVSQDRQAIEEAIRAAEWICANRSLPGGGFRHDAEDGSGPYLGDTLAMGRAFLALYSFTADRVWLEKAGLAAGFIAMNFRGDRGYLSGPERGILKSKSQIDENVGVVRFANLLARYTGNAKYREMAEYGMRFLAAAHALDQRGFLVAGVLLADHECNTDPQHVTVVGRKDDLAAQVLFAAAIRQSDFYRRIEWFDDREGPLPNADVEYPVLGRAAAFRCTQNSCSAPVYSPEQLTTK